MPKVIADITMSLDGYVTGPGADEQHGLGDAPELHTWVTEQDAVDTEILERATAQSGAVVMGRRLFDIVDGPGGWNEDMGYGADQTGTPPFFVVTHAPPQDVRLERELGMRFTFVDDLAAAVDQARAAATHGDVVIMGGGDVIGQALEQGLVDELRIHLAPMLLGGGRRSSNPARVRCTANATFARRRTRSTSPTSACKGTDVSARRALLVPMGDMHPNSSIVLESGRDRIGGHGWVGQFGLEDRAPSPGHVPLASGFVPTMHRATPGTRTPPSLLNAITFAVAFVRIRSRAGSSTC